MYCNCAYRENPIRRDHLLKVLLRAIWPSADEHSEKEAIAAKNLGVKFLLAVTPADLEQLKTILCEVWDASSNKPGSLGKLTIIYNEAAATNKHLPRTLLLATGRAEPRKSSVSSRRTKAQPSPKSTTKPPPKASSPPPKGAKPSSGKPSGKSTGRPTASRDEEPAERTAPRPSEACRACDGRGVRKKTDKENVMKESVSYCSRCGGSGKEPSGPPKKGRGRGRYAPHQEEDEDEKDANKAADAFLKKYGYGKWGQ